MSQQRTMFTLIFILTSFAIHSSVRANDSPAIVYLPQGGIQGTRFQSRDGVEYSAFLGIPYGKNPGRFQPLDTSDLPKWYGIRDGTKAGPFCAQRNVIKNITVGSENCFVLNVYSRKLDGKLPVMVYIHGGGYNWGTSHIHGAKFLMDEKIVLVTINYRLGVFGFLSTGDTVIQGNLGLKDQVAALKWIQNNIHHFGGDPNLVTIFGESAGGSSVSLLVLSPMAKGLFHRAISQSGAALNYWSCLKNPKLTATELGKSLRCDTSSSQALADCLSTKSLEEIIHHNWVKWGNDPTVAVGPVIEKLRPGQSDADVFLSKAPYQLLMTGSYNKVPWIAGVVREEGEYLHASPILSNPSLVQDLNERFNQVAPITLTYYEDEKVKQEDLDIIGSSIKKFYFDDQPIGEKTRQALTDMYSDRYFIHGVYKTAVMQAQHSPVYLYLFNFTGSFSFMNERGFQNVLGVTHKDDLQYIFNGISIAPDPQPGPELTISRYLTKNWAHFAKTGTPHDREWEPLSLREALGTQPLGWYKIDETPEKIKDPFKLRNKFWDNLLQKYPQTTSYSLPRPEGLKVVDEDKWHKTD